MAISWDSFDKIWASTSPLTPYSFSDPNYAQGWNFIGSTPPARQMWDSIQKQNDEKFKYLRDNFGTPNIVTQASQMTDTDKVYVYLGSEAGWNNGHWYYYDEGTSSWADGGVYNSVAFVTDTTLSIAGQPADAQVVGDKFAEDENEFNEYVKSKTVTIEPVNWLNLNDPDFGAGNILADGTIDSTAGQSHSGYIPVNVGDVVRWYRCASTTFAIYVGNAAVYDKNKNVILAEGWSSNRASYTVPNGVAYIRVSIGTSAQTQLMVVKNTTLSSDAKYSSYFDPYVKITENFVTPQANEILENPAPLVYETSPHDNIVLNSDPKAGVYRAPYGGNVVYEATAGYHCFKIPLKPNTYYYIKAGTSFRWWAITKNGVTTSYGESNTFNGLYSGDNDTFYATITDAYWTDELYRTDGIYPPMVSEGIYGNAYHNKTLVGANNLTQNNMSGFFSCALPKQRGLYLTQNIPMRFYHANILGLPDVNLVSIGLSGKGTNFTDKGISVDTSATTSLNYNYEYTIYDDNLNVVSRLDRSPFRIIADNVQDCSVLIIGDSTVLQTAKHLQTNFTARGKTVTSLGTQGDSITSTEGRSGWSAGDYCGASDRGKTSANAFWNPAEEKFDFAYYMTQQGYASVDFVVIQLGTNDLGGRAIMDTITTAWGYVKTIIDSILEWNPSQKIILNLPAAVNANCYPYGNHTKIINAKFRKYNEYAIYQSTTLYSTNNVRTSLAHLVLDPETEISDQVHPTNQGYDKLSLALLNAINVWQNT